MSLPFPSWINFKYLGSRVQDDGDCAADVKHRTVGAIGRFTSLWCIWTDVGLPRSMEARLYKVVVQSTITHGFEGWYFDEIAQRTLHGTNAWMSAFITSRSAHEEAS